MPIYAIIASDAPVETHFSEANRHRVSGSVWFVRSPLVTSGEIRELLGIKVGGPTGIIVAAGRYTGVTSADFVEKLRVWEGRE